MNCCEFKGMLIDCLLILVALYMNHCKWRVHIAGEGISNEMNCKTREAMYK